MPYTKKSKKTKTYHKKSHRKAKKASSQIITLHCPFRRGSQMFPDRYTCTGHVNFSTSFAVVGSAGVNAYWEQYVSGNQITHTNGPATSINRAGFGAAGSSVPSGLFYLLGDPNKSGSGVGANAPYFYYRVKKSTIKTTVIPLNAVAAGTSAPVQVTVFPTTAGAGGGEGLMTMNQYAEQPYAKSVFLPVALTAMPKSVINSMSSLKLYGDKYKSTIENGVFDGSYSTDPVGNWYWQIKVGTIAASTADFSINGTCTVDLYYEIEFFGRQTYVTAVPT